MSKICDNCGCEMPEEATFCLKCFHKIALKSETLQDLPLPVSKSGIEKSTKRFITPEKIHILLSDKKIKAVLMSTVIILILLVSVSAVAAKLTNNSMSKVKDGEPSTIMVPVTEPDGTAVTDVNGENVYEAVEVTTEKHSFWNTVFNKDESTTENNGGGFFASLLGDNKSDTDSDTNGIADVPSVNVGTSPSENPTIGNLTDSTQAPNGNTQPSQTVSSEADFSYSVINDKIKIIKYNGNDANVVVPAVIGGKVVSYIGANAFSGNSSIKTIAFENFYDASKLRLSFQNAVIFTDLPNLKQIILPADASTHLVNADGEYTNDYYFEFYKIFGALLSLSFVGTTDNYGSNHINSENGVIWGPLIQGGTSSIGVLYYPNAKKDKSFTVPASTNTVFSIAFAGNDYVEKISIHKNIKKINGSDFSGCSSLNCFEVESGNVSGYYSHSGVILGDFNAVINNCKYKTIVAYPPHKKDARFDVPDVGVPYAISGGFNNNPYLETLKLPSAKLYGDMFTDKNAPSGLKKILLPAGDSLTADSEFIVRNYASGKCQTELY